MRKYIYNIFAVLAAAFALSTAVSCQEEVPANVEPVFPEMVTNYDVVPGTELHLTITPDLSWTVTVSEAGYKWFKIQDGRSREISVSGAASEEPIDITIVTSKEPSFSIRACEVSLSMGGKSFGVLHPYQTQGRCAYNGCRQPRIKQFLPHPGQ